MSVTNVLALLLSAMFVVGLFAARRGRTKILWVDDPEHVIAVPPQGGEYVFVCKNFPVIKVDRVPEWAHVEVASDKLLVSIPANTDGAKRNLKLTVRVGELSDRFTFWQQPLEGQR
jgi:hypothetical protein